MPGGKPAGLPCPQLDAQRRCRLYGRPERPAVCASLQPEPAMCGHSAADALAWLARLEDATRPAGPDAVRRRSAPLAPSLACAPVRA